MDQARDVVAEGGREIVLTGVNIGDFGRTTGKIIGIHTRHWIEWRESNVIASASD